MNQCELRFPVGGDWPRIAELLAEAIPNALASRFGRRFGALYYRHLAESPGACSVVAVARAEILAGVVIGTLDRQSSRRLSCGLKLRLLAAAHLRILKPEALLWLASSTRTTPRTAAEGAATPQAELLALAVDPRFRGEHLASRLIERIEVYFRDNGLRQPYQILTEKHNRASNSFYAKTGARLAGTNLYHGRQINVWHKALS